MTPSERLSLAIHLESAAIAPQTSELIEAGKEALREMERQFSATTEDQEIIARLLAENRELRDRLGGKWVPWDERSDIHQQLIPQKDGGLLSAAMTVLSECQDGPPSEQSICSLRDAVDAAIR